MTYHYGSWVPSVRYGWVWRPGYSFAPAWVYWYYGPSYVAWVPVGYYSSYYGHYGRGFRYGVHGWAGGSWGLFADWTFCSTRSYRQRDLRHHVRRGRHLARDTRSYALERGLITTDSRPEVRQRAGRRGFGGGGGEDLPDVTAFVARQRNLPNDVTERVFGSRRAVARGEEWERPEGARPNAARSRVAAPRGERDLDAWRGQSGRLRATPPERSAVPRGRTAGPADRGETARWWQRESEDAARRGAGSTAGRARGAVPRAGEARPGDDDRPPVVRRVWEGIRDRQRAQPSPGRPPTAGPPTGRPSAGAPDARRPATGRRPTPSTQPRSAPSRRPPSAQPRSAPTRREPQANRAAPSRRAPSAERRSEPPRQSTAARQPAPAPRQSSFRGGSGSSQRQSSARAGSSSQRRSSVGSGGSSSRRSSARPSNQGSRRSSGGSSGRGSARRRPPR